MKSRAAMSWKRPLAACADRAEANFSFLAMALFLAHPNIHCPKQAACLRVCTSPLFHARKRKILT